MLSLDRERPIERKRQKKQNLKRNKIIIFWFTIVLQCHSTFTMAL